MTTPLAKTLGIQPGQRIRIMNAPDKYVRSLGRLPDGAEIVHKGHAACDFVHLFVRSAEDLKEQGPVAVKAVKPDGVLWVSYPKRSSGTGADITRDVGWEIMSELGLRPVAQISIDAKWSALRFKRGERVGK
jgi:hypothetical protein